MLFRLFIILHMSMGLWSCAKNDCKKSPGVQVGLANEGQPREDDCGIPPVEEAAPASTVQTPPVPIVLVVQNPEASPAAGAYLDPQTVTLSTTTDGSSIYYTLDGSTPTATNTSFLYTTPIVINNTSTLKTLAVKPGYTNSEVVTFEFAINGTVGNPTFTPIAGGYGNAQTVTISTSTTGATIYYTTDGSVPTTSSTVYTVPLMVASTTTINAYATAPIHYDSPMVSGTFTINGAVADPSISPAGGTYGPAQTVTLTSTTTGASFYYTTDGSMPSSSSTLYTGPFSVSSSQSIKAIAVKAGFTDSNVTSAAFTINGTVATPTFSPAAGGYGPTQTVTISTTTTGATIYYTTNGSTPTTSSSVYSSPITVSSTQTIKAFATKAVHVDSALATATFTINGAVATPTFSPAAGEYGPTQTVTISTATAGSTIYYTINGTTPTTSSTLYTGPLSVGTTRTIKAIAVKSAFSNSGVASGLFTINGAVATPTFSVAAGEYSSTQSVTISSTTPGTTIYYTTNNATPTTSSTLYTGPVSISSITVLQALAVKTNWINSGVRSATYNVVTYGIISTIAGSGVFGFDGDGGLATNAYLGQPGGVALDSSGNIYIADTQNQVIRKITVATGIITTIAGTPNFPDYGGDGGAATSAWLTNPSGLAFDASGNLHVSDSYNHRIRKIDKTTGVITTVAGNGSPGSTGDGGPATSASLQQPAGITFDSSGNLYIADQENQRIRKVDTSGNISTVAGNGSKGFSADNVTATTSKLNTPTGVAVDTSGNLYIADSGNHRVRKVVLGTGIITTFAGTGAQGSSGDNGNATSALLKQPKDVKVDSLGYVLIADQYNSKIRMVKTNGIISTVVGTGSNNYTGNGGYAINATLNLPIAFTLDASNNIFIADWYNNAIRKAPRIP